MNAQVAGKRWWIQGALVGGIVGAIAYYFCCRWVQRVLAEESAKHNLAHRGPDSDTLLFYAVGLAILGFVTGAISGACSGPLKAAGVGAGLGILPAFGLLVLIGGGTPHQWVVQPLMFFLGSVFVSGTVAGALGGIVGQRRSGVQPTE
jgi:hypothetical protein